MLVPEEGAVMMRGLLAWPESKPEMALGDWAPCLDLTETRDSLIATVEAPGMEQGDIAISVQESALTIKGDKRRETIGDEERYHRVERASGVFLRRVRLPLPVDASRATATFRNGLLTVRLPKARAAGRATVPVRTE
jgi:HSP20 family protein